MNLLKISWNGWTCRSLWKSVQPQGIYIEIVSFPTDILLSLLIVKKPERLAQTCFVKQFFLEISQNSQENTCHSLFFNKVTGCWLLRKNLWNTLWSQFLQVNFIKDYKAINSLFWNTIWNKIFCFSSNESINYACQ